MVFQSSSHAVFEDFKEDVSQVIWNIRECSIQTTINEDRDFMSILFITDIISMVTNQLELLDKKYMAILETS